MTAKIPTEMIKKVSTVCICIGLCAMLNVLSLLLSTCHFSQYQAVYLGRMGTRRSALCVSEIVFVILHCTILQ